MAALGFGLHRDEQSWRLQRSDRKLGRCSRAFAVLRAWAVTGFHAMMPKDEKTEILPMLDELLQRVRGFTPRELEIDRRFPEAAVLVPITRGPDPEMVLTLRASGLSTHGGEVAFPGGRRDPEDRDLIHTALREAEEEVGLPPGLVEIIGPLSPVVSRHGIKVTPYVGIVPDFVHYTPNDAEIAAVFQVPLSFFCEDRREVTHRIDYQGRSWYVPCYRYDDFKIWGLTAIMVVELVNLLYDAQIPLHQPPASFIDLR
jgi:8-oxo-dGTP pyrophosphatase MutT (NUDIX family)